jgi:hypothetical protein
LHPLFTLFPSSSPLKLGELSLAVFHDSGSHFAFGFREAARRGGGRVFLQHFHHVMCGHKLCPLFGFPTHSPSWESLG